MNSDETDFVMDTRHNQKQLQELSALLYAQRMCNKYWPMGRSRIL